MTEEGDWHSTGFGGGDGRESFDRMAGTLRGFKNGTELDLVIHLPGDFRRRLMLNADELAAATGLAHGESFELRAYTDVWSRPGRVHVFDIPKDHE